MSTPTPAAPRTASNVANGLGALLCVALVATIIWAMLTSTSRLDTYNEGYAEAVEATQASQPTPVLRDTVSFISQNETLHNCASEHRTRFYNALPVWFAYFPEEKSKAKGAAAWKECYIRQLHAMTVLANPDTVAMLLARATESK